MGHNFLWVHVITVERGLQMGCSGAREFIVRGPLRALGEPNNKRSAPSPSRDPEMQEDAGPPKFPHTEHRIAPAAAREPHPPTWRRPDREMEEAADLPQRLPPPKTRLYYDEMYHSPTTSDPSSRHMLFVFMALAALIFISLQLKAIVKK